MDKKRFCWDTRPQAETENIVVCNKVRITVLTARLLRLECECQRKSEPSANQYLSHLCERILEPPTPKVTANT